jgi:NAD(P)-dependent dehydrogenase (short-subunit alcohol dehydrogenase family)
MDWHSKVALITGASSGIGRAVALRLAAMGARVGLMARTTDALESVAAEVTRLGSRALVLTADVTDECQCRRAVEEAVDHFGRLDLLLCSAGVSMRSRFEDTDLAAAERVLRVNYHGTLYTTYHALPHIKASRGSLVAITSLTAKRGTPTYAVYSASKFAVQGLYQALRLELAPDGVHVGIVAPGHVDTPLRTRVLGPDGHPWPTPPPAPFRVWPLDLLVEKVVRLIERRTAEVLLPGIVGPLLALDHLIGTWLGDRWLSRRVANAPLPEGSHPPAASLSHLNSLSLSQQSRKDG